MVQEGSYDGFVPQTDLFYHDPCDINVVQDYGITRDALLVLMCIFGKMVRLEYQFEFFFVGTRAWLDCLSGAKY